MPPISIPCPTSARKRSLADKVLAGLKAFVVRWQQDRAARALSGLSDYMLKDMGISRGEIQPSHGVHASTALTAVMATRKPSGLRGPASTAVARSKPRSHRQ